MKLMTKHQGIGVIILLIAIVLDVLVWDKFYLLIAGFLVGWYGVKIDELKKSNNSGEKDV